MLQTLATYQSPVSDTENIICWVFGKAKRKTNLLKKNKNPGDTSVNLSFAFPTSLQKFARSQNHGKLAWLVALHKTSVNATKQAGKEGY